MALVQAPLRALDIISPLDRTGGLLRAASIAVSLQELAYQFLAPSVQLPFEVALAHLLSFARTEKGFGLSEGGHGRRMGRLVGRNGAVGHGSHRSTLPPPPLRIPDQRTDPDGLERLTGTVAAPVQAASTAGGAQRDPEGTSREPRRRHGHLRGVSLPTTRYQNVPRMSRGRAGGRIEAPRHR